MVAQNMALCNPQLPQQLSDASNDLLRSGDIIVRVISKPFCMGGQFGLGLIGLVQV